MHMDFHTPGFIENVASNRAAAMAGLELVTRADSVPSQNAVMVPGLRPVDAVNDGDYARIKLPPIKTHAAVVFRGH